ncbi:MAG: FAD-dependent oxidoreductase [Pseudomonadota bacterium]
MAERAEVVVIGAGMAGLACAEALHRAGRRVVVLEKSRGLGGRCATRRRLGLTADHGSPYAVARDAQFSAAVAAWSQAGAAAAWPQAGTDHHTGQPGMSALAKPMAVGLDVRLGERVEALDGAKGGWRLTIAGESADIEAETLALAIPAAQAHALLGTHASAFPGLEQVEMEPCWTMIASATAPAPDRVLIEGDGAPLKLAIRDSAKPGRAASPETWVLHAGADWTRAHLEEAPDAVSQVLWQALSNALGQPLPAPEPVMMHRWLYARVARPLGQTHAYDPALGIGLAGDWCQGPGVEAAWLSGRALAQTMLGS